MKNMIKKITICTLFMALLSMAIFSSVTKPQASWSGPTSLKPYQQQETDMRAVWVATVGNLNIDPQIGKTQAAITRWKNNYLAILDQAEANNLNTIVFQVRPSNDAFYPSKYNPWSSYLVPDGTDPGWDPLEWMIEVTHERGMEYHAWLNPYRASTSTVSKSITADDSVTKASRIIDYDVNEYNEYKANYFSNLRSANPDIDNPVMKEGEELYQNVLYGTEGMFILNPASEKVQRHIQNTIAEIVDNYNIDGIHFDDYFYPATTSYKGTNATYKKYTFSCEPSVDMADYNRYVGTVEGTPLSIYDWRRENVNKLIKNIGIMIREKNENKETKCAFGISPASRWAPTVTACSSAPERAAEGGMEGSCYNYYSYSDLYADTYKWAKEEWIDYITPQNYTNLKGDYGYITKWWSNALVGSKTKLYIGTALYQVSDSWGDSSTAEIHYQILYNQTNGYNVDGYFLFSYESLKEKNGAAAMSPVNKYDWKYAALTPLYGHYTYDKQVKEKSEISSIKKQAQKILVEFTKVAGAKGYGLYEFKDGETKVFDVTHRVDVKLNNSKPFEITPKEGCEYVIVTYDQDNTIFEDYTVISLNNKAPEVIVELDNETYKTGATVNVKINVKDVDSTKCEVIVGFVDGDEVTYQQIKSTQNTNSEFVIQYQLPKVVSNDAKIEVQVSDELNTVKVTKNITVTNDTPKATFNLSKCVIDQEKEMSIEVTDDDDLVTYELLVSYDGESFNFMIDSGEVALENGKGTINFKFTGQTVSKDCKFKLVLNDGINRQEIVSNSFEVANGKQSSQTSPCPTGMAINQLLALITTLSVVTVILRKKGNK